MVKNIIDVGERESRVINIVKAKYGLKTRSEAISLITKMYEKNLLEPELRPEYLEKLKKIRKEKYHKFSSYKDFEKAVS